MRGVLVGVVDARLAFGVHFAAAFKPRGELGFQCGVGAQGTDRERVRLPGGGGGGTGNGGGMGGGGRQSGANQVSDSDRGILRELTDPPEGLNIMQKDPKGGEVDLTDDMARKRVFFTDGRKTEKSKDDSYQEIDAKWDGKSLISEEKTSRGKFSRTLELAPNGQQLYETVRIDASAYSSNRSAPQVYIQYVYDADQGDSR